MKRYYRNLLVTALSMSLLSLTACGGGSSAANPNMNCGAGQVQSGNSCVASNLIGGQQCAYPSVWATSYNTCVTQCGTTLGQYQIPGGQANAGQCEPGTSMGVVATNGIYGNNGISPYGTPGYNTIPGALPYNGYNNGGMYNGGMIQGGFPSFQGNIGLGGMVQMPYAGNPCLPGLIPIQESPTYTWCQNPL